MEIYVDEFVKDVVDVDYNVLHLGSVVCGRSWVAVEVLSDICGASWLRAWLDEEVGVDR